jgi:DNA primase
MDITKDLLDDLLKHTEISQVISSYIPLTKKGKNHLGLCPFHDDKHPSMSVSSDKQIFKCFVCGVGGSALQFVQYYEKINFPQAIKKLSDLVGFDDPRLQQLVPIRQIDTANEPYYRCLEDVLTYYQFGLASEEGQLARQYLTGRGMTAEIIERFQIGYAVATGTSTIPYLIKRGHSRSVIESLGLQASNRPDFDRLAGRIIFPIFNPEGKVVGFSGRILVDQEGQAKYVNSSESPVFNKRDILFNYHLARLETKKSNHVYVLEGFMDVIALSKANIPQAVALMGTAFTEQHAQLLKRLNVEVRIALDNDQAGQEAMLKMIPLLNKNDLNYRFVVSSIEGKDADEILIDHGEKGLKEYLNQLVNKISFSLKYYQNRLDMNATEQKASLIKMMIPLIAGTPQVEQLDYLMKIGEITGYPLSVLQQMTKKFQEKSGREDFFERYRPESKVIPKLQQAEKAILYNMLHSQEAIGFYQQHVQFFYTEVYRKIASFLIDYDDDKPPTIADLINDISVKAPDSSQTLIDELTLIQSSKEFPLGTVKDLEEYLSTIKVEKAKYSEKQKIFHGISGKDVREQARLIHQIKGKHHEVHDEEEANHAEKQSNEDE